MHLNKLPNRLPYGLPSGSGSHRTVWQLFAKICQAWEPADLEAAAISQPKVVEGFPDIGSYEDVLLSDLRERGAWNYLTEEHGFFFGELDGINRWTGGQMGWWYYYPNPLSKAAPDEYTWEAKCTWATILYTGSMLVGTPARRWIDDVLKIIGNAPANEELKSQVTADLQLLLK
ncbi:MAG: hypothetical protein HYY01_01675 [Chloroflexi bacterium]|nr:hypothetical protein [Chloroflexota bacterium]